MGHRKNRKLGKKSRGCCFARGIRKAKSLRKAGGFRNAAHLTLFSGVCAAAGVLAGAANYYYNYSLRSRKRDESIDQLPSEKEYVDGRRWMKTHPAREDVYIRADDGLWLHANYIPADPSAGGEGVPFSTAEKDDKRNHRYVICVHGYLDLSSSMGLYARVYRDRYGMNVLLPDLRGHGMSDGHYVGMGLDDSGDILRWIDWVLEKDPEAQIVLHGISMGAATVLMTTGRNLPRQVAAAVADSSYTSAMDIFKSVYYGSGSREKGEQDLSRKKASFWMRAVFRKLSAPVLLSMVRVIALFRTGYDISKASPLEAVARSKTPTLFIHGQADTFVPPRMMPPLYRAAACPKAFLWIPGAEHVQSVNVDPEAYWAKVEKFLHARGLAL